jgi:hypothetical protein
MARHQVTRINPEGCQHLPVVAAAPPDGGENMFAIPEG